MIQNILAAARVGLLAMAANEVPSEVKRAYRLMLLICGTLLAVFVLTILLMRMLRRYRQTFLSGPRKPTASQDLWSQYRLPKELEEDEPSDQDPKKE